MITSTCSPDNSSKSQPTHQSVPTDTRLDTNQSDPHGKPSGLDLLSDLPIGSPQRTLIRALLAAERADRQEREASVRHIGDPDRRAVQRAEWDAYLALAEVARVREQIAADWLLGMRLALWTQPDRVVDLLRDALRIAEGE